MNAPPIDPFAKIPVPVLTLDADGTVLTVNRSAQVIFGSSLSGGTSWKDYLAACQVPAPVVERLHTSASRIPLQLRDGDGEPWPCETIVHNPGSGQGTMVVCWPTCATERPTTTDTARRLDAVNDAALHVANSFNNHLTAITGILQGMQSQPTLLSSDDLREALRITRRAAVGVADLQRTVHPPPPRLGSVDPAVVVMDAVNAIRPDLHAGTTLATTHTDQRSRLHADRAQIRDAVLHLLMNARDAITAKGTIHVRIEPGTAHPDRLPAGLGHTKFVVIEVQDDGDGIPADLLPQVYKPFFSTRERPGLGLASVYQTVKQHGGGITVDSKVGVGSTFRLFLPAEHITPAVPSVTRVPGADDTTPVRVLVIDDDASVRRVVRKSLEREGMTVDEASCGEEGLERHQGNGAGYDAIVLDIIMPGMSGWDVLHHLRRSQDDTPVVLQSGFMTEVDHEAARHASAFLRKPYDLAELVGAVKGALAPPG